LSKSAQPQGSKFARASHARACHPPTREEGSVFKAFARTMSVAVLAVGVWVASANVAFATSIPVGYVSWDVNFPGSAGQFDIVNGHGPNPSPFPDPTFPVTTTLTFSSLSLHVDFSNGTSTTFGSAYFTPAGISFNGNPIPIGGLNPLPTGATLT